MNSKRYFALDTIRGFALLNMIIYHGIWDLVYLFGYDWQWYQAKGAYIWQQCICWTFIFLSGFCYPFGKNKLKRAGIILACGCLISLVTRIAMPQNCVRFGILTLLGSCMLCMIPVERMLRKIKPIPGAVVSALLFLLTRNVNAGFLGFGSWKVLALPEGWYCNLITTYLGFPMPEFRSTDYFSFIPWVFIFVAGYFANCLFGEKKWLQYLENHKVRMLECLGRHSLVIYMVHQPVLYVVLGLLQNGAFNIE